MKRIASRYVGLFTKQRRMLFAVMAACGILVACLLSGCASNASSSASSKSPSSSASESPASPEAVKDVAQPEPKAATGVRNVLVIGSDKWEKYDPHADLMCLLRIDLDNKVVHEITVPRDTKYDFWGEYNKLNQMLTWVGVEAQVQAVSQVVGVPIDYYVMIDLYNFVALGDSLGGIEANLPYPITYSFYTHDFADESYDAGQQLLTGWRAMALSRARTGYGNSGLANEDMIRQFVDRQMLTTLMGYAYRDGADGAVSLVQGLQGLVETNIPADEQAAWIKALGSDGSFRVVGTTGPFVGGIDDTADGLWLVYEDPEGWANLMAAVQSGGDLWAATDSYRYPAFTEGTPNVVETTVVVGG